MKKNNFDVVIIGGGIGGLICGCYLMQKGIRTVIIERNSMVGGYCNSFKIQDISFDGCVHALGNVSKGSIFYKILEDFDIVKDLNLIQHNPSDTVVTPEFVINFWNDINKTVDELVEIFPEDKESISKFFFDIINKKNLDSVLTFRNKTFQMLLDGMFSNNKLKSILSVFVYGDCGVPSFHISAFAAIKHYQQFIVNGGYCPQKGVVALPNLLAHKFTDMGGKLELSKEVIRINLNNQNDEVQNIELKDGEIFTGKFFVSNCDAKRTFLNLIGEEKINNLAGAKIHSTKASLSLFVIYIGLEEGAMQVIPDKTNRWYILKYDYQEVHRNEIDYKFDINKIDCFLVCPNYLERRLTIFIAAPYISDEYWRQNRTSFMNHALVQVGDAIPGLLNSVLFKTCITPSGLKKWTMNSDGAAYGWAATPNQIIDPFYFKNEIIKNLFLCGHWTTLAAGVPGVSIVGQRVANRILKIFEKEFK